MMKVKTKLMISLALTVGLCLMLSGFSTAAYKVELNSPYTSSVPTIDGNFTTADEWTDAVMTNWWYEPTSDHPDNYIYLYFMNNEDTLFVMADITPDNTSDTDDYFAIGFDENLNGIFTSDWWASEDAEFYVSMYRNSDATFNIYMPQPSDRVQAFFGFDYSPNEEDYPHTMIEIAIPIANFDYEGQVGIGDTMGIHCDGYGTLAPEWVYPQDSNMIEDLLDYYGITPTTENWGEITLGAKVPAAPAIPPVTEAANHAVVISEAIIAIGFIMLLGAVAFRKELDRYYLVLVVASLLIMLFGALNWNYEYVKTIPYIYQ